MAKTNSSGAKKNKNRQVLEGVAHVHASFNNTIVTISDGNGNTLSWSTAGSNDFRGARKSTPFAAQIAAEKAGIKAQTVFGVKVLTVEIKGAGPGRESALRALHKIGFNIVRIKDVTPLAHNGCRPSKRRRV
jgi:small subunit ribosomal protein S11